jgi:hypothetical protein
MAWFGGLPPGIDEDGPVSIDFEGLATGVLTPIA